MKIWESNRSADDALVETVGTFASRVDAWLLAEGGEHRPGSRSWVIPEKLGEVKKGVDTARQKAYS